MQPYSESWDNPIRMKQSDIDGLLDEIRYLKSENAKLKSQLSDLRKAMESEATEDERR